MAQKINFVTARAWRHTSLPVRILVRCPGRLQDKTEDARG